MIDIIDTCGTCGKPIYWGPADQRPNPPDPDPSQFQYWRHTETQVGPCSWGRPIEWAKPIKHRTPPVGATNVSDTLKAELKRVYPDEFPDY